MDRRSFLATAAATTVGLAGCTNVFGSNLPDFDIGMQASAFVPREISASPGETVIWGNNNDRPHTVTAYEGAIPESAEFFASGGFDSEKAARDGYNTDLSGVIDPGNVYEHTFEVVGTYNYFCIPHEKGNMIGTVTVEE
ncbi:MAG: plastocyanin/azurin family copper-binding protein [Halobacteriales archaeon]